MDTGLLRRDLECPAVLWSLLGTFTSMTWSTGGRSEGVTGELKDQAPRVLSDSWEDMVGP